MIKKISVVISAYNEKDNIKLLYPRLINVLDKIKIKYEIIFVIDGDDGTKEMLSKLTKNRKNIMINYSNKTRGFANSFKIGFKKISKDATHVITMDADVNHHPEEIPNFLNEMKKTNCDIVIGSRYIIGSKMYKREFIKGFVSALANLFFPFILRLKVKDISSGFRLYKIEVINYILPKIKRKGFEVLAEILFLSKKYKIKEIPIDFTKRHAGKSKFKLFDTFFGYIKILLNI